MFGLNSSVARQNAAVAAGIRGMAGRWTPEKVPMGPADPILGVFTCVKDSMERQYGSGSEQSMFRIPSPADIFLI